MQANLKTGSEIRFIRVLATVAVLAAVAFISITPLNNNDFWLQAKIGAMIVQNGEVPRTVYFPFTPIQTATFYPQEWLPSILFYGFVRGFGEAALPFILCLLSLSIFGLLVRQAYTKSKKNLAWALLLGLLAIGGENFHNAFRPEIIGLIFLLIYWAILEKIRKQPSLKLAIAAFAIAVLWANSHGSFILAPVLAGIYAVGSLADGLWPEPGAGQRNWQYGNAKRFMGIAIAVAVGSLINPIGVHLWGYVLHLSGSEVVRQNIVEWIPTTDLRLMQLRGWWIGLACLALAVAGFLLRRKMSAVDILLLALFIALGTRANRFLIYSGIIASFTLAPLAQAGWNTAIAQRRIFAVLGMVSVLLLGLAARFGNAKGAYPWRDDWNESLRPGMVAALANPRLHGNVLNTFHYGSELIYRAYPRLQPSIDGRIDSYGDDYFLMHQALLTDDKRFNDFVAQYGVRYLLLDPHDSLLFTQLKSWHEGQWKLIFEDPKAALLERTAPQ